MTKMLMITNAYLQITLKACSEIPVGNKSCSHNWCGWHYISSSDFNSIKNLICLPKQNCNLISRKQTAGQKHKKFPKKPAMFSRVNSQQKTPRLKLCPRYQCQNGSSSSNLNWLGIDIVITQQTWQINQSIFKDALSIRDGGKRNQITRQKRGRVQNTV